MRAVPGPSSLPRALPAALLSVLVLALTLAVPGLAAGPGLTAGPVTLDPEELGPQVDALAARALEELHTSGLAVAVVTAPRSAAEEETGEADDAPADGVLFARGYGLADREAGAPVSADTAFAVGSTTKALTAALVGTLVDDGLLTWDTPVREVLPGFRLADRHATEHLTVRDLLTHRSGLPRHDLAWYGSPASRRELFERLAHLEPSADLRERFQYQNLMYLTAGLLVEELTGKRWETLMAERLLEPLGMEGARIATVEGLEDVARGYRWEAPDAEGDDPESTAEGAFELLPYREASAIAPAGALFASAREMGRWAAFQLGDGRAPLGEAASGEPARVLEAATLETLHSPQTVAELTTSWRRLGPEVTPYLLYGLGWFIQPYRGEHLVQHGGNIDGFSAFVVFAPHREVGVVVLANTDATPAPIVLALSVLDRLLGLPERDWIGEIAGQLAEARAATEEAEEATTEETPSTGPGRELEEYAGTYENPGYGQVVVEVVQGTADGGEGGPELRLTFNPLTAAPLEHRRGDAWTAPDTVLGDLELLFREDLTGAIAGLEMALERSLRPIAFDRLPPPGPGEALASRLLGTYVLGEGATPAEVFEVRREEGGTLVVLQAGARMELEPMPEGEGTRFKVLGAPGNPEARFVLEGDGPASAIEVHQFGQVVTLERREGG